MSVPVGPDSRVSAGGLASVLWVLASGDAARLGGWFQAQTLTQTQHGMCGSDLLGMGVWGALPLYPEHLCLVSSPRKGCPGLS